MGRGVFWLRVGARGGSRKDSPATELDVAMMGRALELAERAASLGEVPIGAVVFHSKTGAIVGEASNRRENPPDPAGHAELLAIRAAASALGDWRLNEFSLAVTLEPCPMCAGAVVNARLGRLVYGAPDPKAGAVRTLMRIADDPRLNHRAEVVRGVRSEDCSRVLREFFEKLRIARK